MEKLNLSVMYVDDEEIVSNMMQHYLAKLCAKVYIAYNARTAFEIYMRYRPDVVITDIVMPEIDGLSLAKQLKAVDPQLPVIITTAFSEVNYLIRAIEIGVQGFISKPFAADEILPIIKSAALPIIQFHEIERLKQDRLSCHFYPSKSGKMKEVVKQIALLATTDFNILLTGEKGTGKTRAAAAIHNLSGRSKRPFIHVYCGIADKALDSNLFGKYKGPAGSFTAAEGGTIFLHGIADASMYIQSKILRVLEEKAFCPIGDTTPITCDVRILASIIGDPKKAVAEGRLLEGLLYKIRDAVITMPSLRDIPDYIPDLALSLLVSAAEDIEQTTTPILSDDAINLIRKQPWPGNVRELRNILRMALMRNTSHVITAATLLPLLKSAAKKPLNSNIIDLPDSFALQDVEKWAFKNALAQAGGKKMQAAEILGIDYKRFIRKFKRYFSE